MKRVFLIGYMGSGKTTLGKAYSAATGLQFVDLIINSPQFRLVSREDYMKSARTAPENYPEAIFVIKRLATDFPGFTAQPSMASDAFSGDTMLEINFSTGQFPVFI